MNSQRIFKFSISRKSDNHNEANAKAVDQSATEEVLANASREENAVESVEVVICEMADADYSSFTWPSAVVLAQFIWWHRQEFSGKTVLEISSGTCLPGMVAAKVGASVIVSEYAFNRGAVERCRRQAKLNDVTVPAIGVVWGEVTQDLLLLPALDVLLLSDVFYEPAHFSDVLFTIRDENWNIHALLLKFGLTCLRVGLGDFGAEREAIAESRLPGASEILFFQCFLAVCTTGQS